MTEFLIRLGLFAAFVSPALAYAGAIAFLTRKRAA
jgi:hypothetical protein